MFYYLIDTLHCQISFHSYFLFSYDTYTSGWQINIGFLTLMYFK